MHDNSPQSHFSAMMRSCWLRRAVRSQHYHVIKQAARRWRGGRRDDSTRRKILISTQACSGAGLCIAESGECECFDGFTGDACQRRISTCGVGGKCSGHGQCLPMHHLARAKEALPLSEGMSSYGDDHTVREHTGTWDWNTMMGCACDSSWSVPKSITPARHRRAACPRAWGWSLNAIDAPPTRLTG